MWLLKNKASLELYRCYNVKNIVIKKYYIDKYIYFLKNHNLKFYIWKM